MFKKCLSTLLILGTSLAGANSDDANFDQVLERYSHNVSSIPDFSGELLSISPQLVEISTSDELVVQDIHTVWDPAKFLCPRVPARIGHVQDQGSFNQEGVPRCIHLPIKLPGSDIRVPAEYAQFQEALQQILDHEYTANPHFDEYYAYLTVDQGFIPRESYQRVPGPHVDGLPRDRDNPQTVVDHAYLVTNAIPTRFYFQPFNMTRFDLNQHHFFAIFRALSDEKQTFTVRPYDINLMNAYSVHTPMATEEDVLRTFIRLEFSVLEFDRQGNSINPAFAEDEGFQDYPFEYIPRPIPDHLTLPVDIFMDQPVTSDMYQIINFDLFGRLRLVKSMLDNPRPSTSYHHLPESLGSILGGTLNGFVIVKDYLAQGIAVFEETEDELQVSMVFTCATGPQRELSIFTIRTLSEMAGNKELVFVEDANNTDMIQYFERAAEMARVSYSIREMESCD